MSGGFGVLRHQPGVLPLAAASVLARLPFSMVSVAAILLFRGHLHSYAIGGLAIALYSAAAAATSPLLGRLATRLGARRVVVGVAVVRAGLLVAVVALAQTGNAPLVTTTMVLAGAAEPPVTAVVRSAFARLPEDARAAALSLDSILIEVIFITGPLLVGLVVLVATSGYAVVIAGALALLGAVLIRPTSDAPPPAAGGRTNTLRLPAVRAVGGVSLAQVLTFASVETAYTAACNDQHHAPLVGVLAALWATASATGGIVYGMRRWSGSPGRRYAITTAMVGVGFLPLALTDSPYVLMALLPIAGLSIAPCASSSSDLIAAAVPEDRQTEAFAWTSGTAPAAGGALGFALGGALVQSVGVRSSFAVSALVALLAVGIPLIERRRLP